MAEKIAIQEVYDRIDNTNFFVGINTKEICFDDMAYLVTTVANMLENRNIDSLFAEYVALSLFEAASEGESGILYTHRFIDNKNEKVESCLEEIIGVYADMLDFAA